MQVELDSRGRKVYGYGRPYVEGDEIQRNYELYQPNGPGPNYGLYDGPQPVAQRWVDYSTRYIRNFGLVPTGDPISRPPKNGRYVALQ